MGGSPSLWHPLRITARRFWSALDPHGGDPFGRGQILTALSISPVSRIEDVVVSAPIAGSAAAPTMFAFVSASNGNTLWSFAAGSSVNSGALIVGEIVYWGSGYPTLEYPLYWE